MPPSRITSGAAAFGTSRLMERSRHTFTRFGMITARPRRRWYRWHRAAYLGTARIVSYDVKTALEIRRASGSQAIVDLVMLQPPILARASESCPTSLGIVDAVRLATAVVWQNRMRQRLVVATHDRDLALAARSVGFEIRGV